jgi:hypothetical protein
VMLGVRVGHRRLSVLVVSGACARSVVASS